MRRTFAEILLFIGFVVVVIGIPIDRLSFNGDWLDADRGLALAVAFGAVFSGKRYWQNFGYALSAVIGIAGFTETIRLMMIMMVETEYTVEAEYAVSVECIGMSFIFFAAAVHFLSVCIAFFKAMSDADS